MFSRLVNDHKDQFLPNKLSISFENSQNWLIVNFKGFNPSISMGDPKDYTFKLHLIFPVDEATFVL